MTNEKLKMVEDREAEAPDEDELHLRADDLEKAHGMGESIAIDAACATLRALAQSRHDRNVPALCAAVRERDVEIAKLRVIALGGWETSRALAIAGLHRGSEKAADEAIARLVKAVPS